MIHSFLLIGQSNMAGRGFPNEVEPIANDKLYVLRGGRWWPMFVPVHCDRVTAGFVSAEGLVPNPDYLRFSAPSLREFGLRYYEEFVKLEDKNKVFLEKSPAEVSVRTGLEHL